MNKIVYDLLLKLEQCDDRHNRCDYLMEHDEITYLLEHIEEKDKQLDKYKNVINKIREYCNYNDEILYIFEPDYDYEENMIENYEVSNFREDILELLEEVE